MHDMLEGVVQYECKEMLKIFVYEKKYFSGDVLTARIARFDYGYFNDKNKPTPFSHKVLKSENNTLKQKGLFFLIFENNQNKYWTCHCI